MMRTCAWVGIVCCVGMVSAYAQEGPAEPAELCMSKSGMRVDCAMVERFDMANAGYMAGLNDAMAGRESNPDSVYVPKAYLRGYQTGYGIVNAGKAASPTTR